jgi:hypothetical protein
MEAFSKHIASGYFVNFTADRVVDPHFFFYRYTLKIEKSLK